MKFTLNCGGQGLVLIDEGTVAELTDELLYAMDIYLDKDGETELIFDFPNEDWKSVRERETLALREFCGSGKMILLLPDAPETELDLQLAESVSDAEKILYCPTGKLLAVSAEELIQCAAYPELQPEKLLEISVEKGRYAVITETDNKIRLARLHRGNQ